MVCRHVLPTATRRFTPSDREDVLSDDAVDSQITISLVGDSQIVALFGEGPRHAVTGNLIYPGSGSMSVWKRRLILSDGG